MFKENQIVSDDFGQKWIVVFVGWICTAIKLDGFERDFERLTSAEFFPISNGIKTPGFGEFFHA